VAVIAWAEASILNDEPKVEQAPAAQPNLPIPNPTLGILTWWDQNNGQVAFLSSGIEGFAHSDISAHRAN